MFNIKHKISKRVHPVPNIIYDLRKSVKGFRKLRHVIGEPIDCLGADHIHNFMTLNCNLNCDYCINRQVVDDYPTFDEHDWEAWAAFLNRLYNFRVLFFNGGEHFTLPYFADFINKLEHNNIFVYSNYPKSAVRQMWRIEPGNNNLFFDFAYNAYEDDAVNIYVDRLKEIPAKINWNVHIINNPKTDIRSLQVRFQKFGIYPTVGDVIWYPELKYSRTREVICKSNEHVLGPDMRFYDCFVKMLYGKMGIDADQYKWEFEWRPCSIYPRCKVNCSMQDVRYV